MTTAERAVFVFIVLNRLVAVGTLRDCFPQCDIVSILAQLESVGLMSSELRPTAHGQQQFYSIKETPR